MNMKAPDYGWTKGGLSLIRFQKEGHCTSSHGPVIPSHGFTYPTYADDTQLILSFSCLESTYICVSG